MLVRSRGAEPIVDSSVFVAPTAALVGRVRVEAGARVMYGAVLDSEASRIEIGPTSIVCENAVLRATSAGGEDHPVLVGDHVFVGPYATLLGCTVEPACYVAPGATVLQGATLEPGGVVGDGEYRPRRAHGHVKAVLGDVDPDANLFLLLGAQGIPPSSTGPTLANAGSPLLLRESLATVRAPPEGGRDDPSFPTVSAKLGPRRKRSVAPATQSHSTTKTKIQGGGHVHCYA